jgi:5-methylcytosine-specific restriction endonuclease McrA
VVSKGTGSKIYKSKAWLALRKQALARDRHTCQLRLGPRCTLTQNLTVDHTVEMWEGGERLPHLSALRTACRSCNSKKHMERLLANKPNPSREW